MDFGRVHQINHLHFALPPQSESTLAFLARGSRPTSLPQVYVGAPTWAHREWVGRMYPTQTSPKDYLKRYSENWDCIELNSSFYALPSRDQVTQWHKAVPSSFKFCPKFPQAISAGLGSASLSAIQNVCETFQHFEENLGLPFLQLPPSFEPRHLRDLRNFLRQLPRGFRVAIEVRNEKWFQNHALIAELAQLYEEFSTPSVVTDVAGRRDVLHSTLRSREALIRFNAHALHPSDYERTQNWVERIADWSERGVSPIYFFIHQIDPLTVPDLARHMIALIQKRMNLRLKTPRWGDEPPGVEQLRLNF